MKQLDREKLIKNIDGVAEYDFAENKVFGSAYLIWQDGEVYEKCYGKVGLTSETPVSPSTLFRLASMTKPITAVATLILVERGLLSLDDGVDLYLPEFKDIQIKEISGNAYAPEKMPTIKNILTHTSGIGSRLDKLAAMPRADRLTLDSAIAYYIENGLDFEPGSTQMYSGTAAFDVLTKIIEKVTGADYLAFLKKEIFEPCEMVDTTFIPTAEQQARMIEMHTKMDGENSVFAMPEGCVFEDVPYAHYLGGAGLVSTLHDYGNFAKMLLNRGKTPNGRILQDSTFDLMCTPQVAREIMPGNERWGLGVRVIVEDAYPYLPRETFGWSGAYGSHFWIDPSNKIFAVFLKNSKFDGGAANESARNFEKAVYSSF